MYSPNHSGQINNLGCFLVGHWCWCGIWTGSLFIVCVCVCVYNIGGGVVVSIVGEAYVAPPTQAKSAPTVVAIGWRRCRACFPCCGYVISWQARSYGFWSQRELRQSQGLVGATGDVSAGLRQTAKSGRGRLRVPMPTRRGEKVSRSTLCRLIQLKLE